MGLVEPGELLLCPIIQDVEVCLCSCIKIFRIFDFFFFAVFYIRWTYMHPVMRSMIMDTVDERFGLSESTSAGVPLPVGVLHLLQLHLHGNSHFSVLATVLTLIQYIYTDQ